MTTRRPARRSPTTRPRQLDRLTLCACALLAAIAPTANAQPENTVYVNDSPSAASTLNALPNLLAAGNQAEAVRSLQALLDTAAHRLAPDADDPDLFHPVRRAVHRRLLADPDLLARYRQEHAPRAARLLDQGQLERVERAYLLTPAGYQAALRLAQRRYELARFHGAAHTLAQLDQHPDLHADGPHAADLLSRVAAQLDNTAIDDLARRWRSAASLPAIDLDTIAIPPPPAATRDDADLLAGGTTPAFEPGDPLWSQPIDADLAPPPDQPLPPPAPDAGVGGPYWLWPTVAGDAVLINDGATLSAWDRHTLRLRWRVPISDQPGAVDAQRQDRLENQSWAQLEDPNTVAADDRAAYASLGLHRPVVPDQEAGVLAVDLDTGRTLWRRAAADMGPSLAFASVRGMPLADEGRVVVALREAGRAGRQWATTVVALHARTGEVAWAQPLGSVGSGWTRSSKQTGAAGTLHDGVVYWYEPMSVLGAYDLQTGRPRWVRRFNATDAAQRRGPPKGAWEVHQPVVIGQSLYALIEPLETVYRIDRRTGRVLGSLPASTLAQPAYLVGVGGGQSRTLAAVGRDTVVFATPDAFDGDRSPGDARATPIAPAGRAVDAGGLLLVPTGRQAVLLDPATARPAGQPIALPRPGAVLPLQDQLLVLDTRVLESLMSPTTAADLLAQRLETDPTDLPSLVSLVLLADRQNVLDAVPDAASRAIDAIDAAAPRSDLARRRVNAERARLTEALLAMVRRLALAAPEPDDALASRLADLALRAADTATTTARAMLAVADLRDAQGLGAQAAELCHRLLADPQLANVRPPQQDATAAALAARKLAAMLPRHGYAIVRHADDRARSLLARAPQGPEGDAQRLRIAERTPVALAAVDALETIALNAASQNNSVHAARALRRALDIARRIRTSGGPVEGTRVATLGARLTTTLADQGALAAAARLRRQLQDFAPIDPDAAPTIRALAEDFNARDRAARIGRRPTAVAQRFEGWRLMTPASTRLDNPAPEHLVMIAAEAVGLWAVAPDRGPIPGQTYPPDDAGPLELVWSAPFPQGHPPTLLELNGRVALFAWQDDDGSPSLRAVSLFDATAWDSGPLDDLTPPQPDHPAQPTRPAVMPDGSQVDPQGWLVAWGQDAVIAARRDGPAIILDPRTGTPRWAGTTRLRTITDAAVGGGTAWLLGSIIPPGGQGQPDATNAAVLALNANDGATRYELVGLDEAPRWIAATDDDALVLATQTTIELHHPQHLKNHQQLHQQPDPVRWKSVGHAAFDAARGWVLGDRLAVMGANQTISIASLDDGKFQAQPVPLVLTDREVPRLTRRGGRIVVLTTGGVTVLDRDGTVVGRDALRIAAGRLEEKLPPAVGHHNALIVPQLARSMAAGEPEYLITTVDTASARIVGSRPVLLPQRPEAVALVDGYAVIAGQSQTFVIRMAD